MAERAPGMMDPESQQKYIEIGTAFRPASPIDRRDLFAGRTQQVGDVIDVLFQAGQHAVIYGERGVGKTSLTTVLAEIIGRGRILALRANCDGTDNFSTIWRKILDEVRLTESMPGMGFKPQQREVIRSAATLLPQENPVSPNDVRKVLSRLGNIRNTVVFIDEFDRLEDATARALFADTIKTFSDQLVPATIVLVGVADNVDELIAEHRSVERALVQIHMPRMSQAELREIVKRGLGTVSMEIEDRALLWIIQLSQGLPHYTHLVAQWSAREAIVQGRLRVQEPDVHAAIKTVLGRTQESIISSYHKATSSARENLYEQVLLACALAPTDDLGYFAAVDVREPLSAIMGKPYDIPAFARHLNALSGTGRGPVLQKAGATRKFRFRFLNPLLQPYVIMRGLASGMISTEMLGVVSRRNTLND